MFKKVNNWVLKFYVENFLGFKDSFKRVVKNERGAGTVEYALIIAVVVVMVIGAALMMKGPLIGFFQDVVKKVKTAFGI